MSMFIRASTEWKGPQYPIAVPFYKQNSIRTPTTNHDLFISRSIPHRRLEIPSHETKCNSRPYMANLIRDVPGSMRFESQGSISNAQATPEFPLTSCSRDPPGCFAQTSAETNARNRVRRISNARRNWNSATNSPASFQNSAEYLRNRTKLFDQHNFHYIQSGDTTALPGTPASSENTYRPQGPASCSKYSILASLENHRFSYTWVDGTETEVVIPDGWYTLATFQNALERIFIDNGDYFQNTDTGTRYFLFKFTADPTTNRISLTIVDPAVYSGIATNQGNAPTEGEPEQVPSVLFPSGSLGPTGLGFTQSAYTTAGIHVSERVGQLANTYKRTHYNPSNPQYATSHAVSSSARTLRLQYNTMNTTASSYAVPYGSGNAVAMAYGVMRDKRVEKDKHNAWPYNTPKLVNGQWTCARDCRMRL